MRMHHVACAALRHVPEEAAGRLPRAQVRGEGAGTFLFVKVGDGKARLVDSINAREILNQCPVDYQHMFDRLSIDARCSIDVRWLFKKCPIALQSLVARLYIHI